MKNAECRIGKQKENQLMLVLPPNAGYARNPKELTADYTDNTDWESKCDRITTFHIRAIR